MDGVYISVFFRYLVFEEKMSYLEFMKEQNGTTIMKTSYGENGETLIPGNPPLRP